MSVFNLAGTLLTNHDAKIATLLEGNHGIAESTVATQHLEEGGGYVP